MATPHKRSRRREGFLEGTDKVLRLNNLYRTSLYGSDRASKLAESTHKALDDVGLDEPDEDLEDSELSDWERREAIARERMRREGRA